MRICPRIYKKKNLNRVAEKKPGKNNNNIEFFKFFN